MGMDRDEERGCRELLGSLAAKRIKEESKRLLQELDGYVPTLGVVRLGERGEQLSYERGAVKRMEQFGLKARQFLFPEDVSEPDFFEAFRKINRNPSIDGILLLKPLPPQIRANLADEAIDPDKDLDGISPVNISRVFAGEERGFAPCTAEAVIETLKAYHIPIEGRRAVVVGRSLVVGRTLAMLLLKENATVTICHTQTGDLPAECQKAEILAVAAGRPRLIDESCVSQGCVVLDVGINVDQNGMLCGDVDEIGVRKKAGALTPVPGGIGAVTTSVLAKHLLIAAKRLREL